jgi:membrane protein YdbS with pleckstrin-like domain
MLPTGHYYPEQTSAAEPVVHFARSHWVVFGSWALVLAIMALTPLVVGLALGGSVDWSTLSLELRTFLTLAVSAYYLFTLAVFLATWIDFYLDAAIITEKRLVDVRQNGLFNHRVSEQSLLRVQDVSVRVRGPLQTFFQFGTVYVETAGEAPNFTMHNLPHPHQVANLILELHNRMVAEGYPTEDRATGSVAGRAD